MDLFKLVGRVAIENAEANDKIDETTGKAENSEGKISSAFKKIGAAVVTYFAVDKIKDFGNTCITMATDVQEMQNKFDVVFAGMTDDVEKWAKNYADSIGRNRNTIKGYLADNQNMFVGMGMTRDAAAGLSENLVSLALDLASFNNLNEDDAVNALSKALMGETESAKRLGAVLNDNTRKMAMERLGYQKKYDELTEAEKMEVNYQAILMQSTDAIGDCERSMDSFKGRTIQLQSAKENLYETIGTLMLPIMTLYVEKMTDVVTWIQSAVEWASQHETAITMLAIAIGTITAAIIAYNIAQNAATIALTAHTVCTTIATAATTAFGTAVAFLTSPITLVVVAIGALIAIIVLCVQHWNEIKEVAVNTWNKIKDTFSGIADWFGNIFNNAWVKITNAFGKVGDFFRGIFNTIKSIFSTIGNSIGDAVSGAFSNAVNWILSKAIGIINGFIGAINAAIGIINEIPGVKISKLKKLDVPEMEEGGVLKKGQVGLLEGNGAEAVVPLEKNTEWINRTAEQMTSALNANGAGNNNSVLADKIDELIDLIKNMKIYLDSNAVVGGIAPKMNKQLGKIYARSERGMA